MPDHEELIAHIPAYARGELEPADSSRLEAHLPGCRECAARVESARLLAGAMREAGEDLFAGHPSEMALRDHALGRRAAEAGALERHLASCAACALEVSVWRRGVAGTAAPVRPWKHLIAAAAGVALGIGLAPILRPPPAPAPHPSTGTAAGLAPLLLLQGPLRGEERPPALSIPEKAPYLLIAVSLPVPSDAPADKTLRLELRPPTGGPTWSIELPAGQIRREMTETGVLVLPVPAASLPAGVYDLRLLEASDPLGPPTMEWRFEIVH